MAAVLVYCISLQMFTIIVIIFFFEHRNVPYDSTDDDIRELFAPFGELEFARVVVDPMTEHSRGKFL